MDANHNIEMHPTHKRRHRVVRPIGRQYTTLCRPWPNTPPPCGQTNVPSSIFQIVLGAALLYAGAELMVRGSSGLAGRLGISPLVIGLTVVAFGTSAPELVVAVAAALRQQSGLVVGNIIGSNIMNIAVVIGISAAVRPIAVGTSTIRFEALIALAAVAAAWLAGLDGSAGRLDAVILLGGFVCFGWYCRRLATRGQGLTRQPQLTGPWSRLPIALPAVLAGLGGLAYGADSLVAGASRVALALGVSTTVIGLTVVAVGTSLPELATSLVAAMRRQPDIAIGNILGSNVFNALLVLGVAGAIHPIDFSTRAKWIDGPVMVALAAALVLMTVTRRRISRAEGFVLLATYAAYLTLLLARPDLGN